MKTYLDCIPCFFEQALRAARIAGADRDTQKTIINELARAVRKFPLKNSPPEMGRIIYRIVRKVSGVDDPYRRLKHESNRMALRMYSKMKNKVRHASDPLLTAVELAVAGNIIDFGAKKKLNVAKELNRIMAFEKKKIKGERTAVFEFEKFRSAVLPARTIMYLGDNAGEIVFDRLLIEELNRSKVPKKIWYAVKERPIINDALREDALECGIDKVAEVISSGLDAPGTLLHLASGEFRERFRKADVVISKGQGNFEALSNQKLKKKGKLFYLFMAKCPVTCRHIGCRHEDIILCYEKSI